jgi:hypothetical protein
MVCYLNVTTNKNGFYNNNNESIQDILNNRCSKEDESINNELMYH